MEPVGYLRALRQWWFIVVALALFGFIAAILTYSSPTPSYVATHTLVDSGDADSTNLARAAFLVTTGSVPERVGAALGEDPDDVTGGVSAFQDEELEGVRVQAESRTPGRAVELADAFATELVGYLDEQAGVDYQAQLDDATRERDAAALAVSAGDATAENRLEDAVERLETLQTAGVTTSGLISFGDTEVDGSGSGTTRNVRAAVGGFVGLLLGILVALMLARFDTRVRSRESAEEAFRAPVLAEIPSVKARRRKNYQIITKADPESLGAEAYRSVRTALVVAHHARQERKPVAGRRRTRPQTSADAGRVMMVVSPGMGEGKTTTSANLAIAFAETGNSVLVLGLDLRRPELHNYFGVDESPGLTDVLARRDGSLTDVVRQTEVTDVSIAPSGHPVEHPGELLARGLSIIDQARTLADIVIIDTAPLLATDDASVLLPLVDDVVLVCRAGRTPTDAAARASELMERLTAPVVGVVLIGSQQLASARSYYRTDYRSRTRVMRGPKPDTPLAVPEPQDAPSNGSPTTDDASGTAFPELSGARDPQPREAREGGTGVA